MYKLAKGAIQNTNCFENIVILQDDAQLSKNNNFQVFSSLFYHDFVGISGIFV